MQRVLTTWDEQAIQNGLLALLLTAQRGGLQGAGRRGRSFGRFSRVS